MIEVVTTKVTKRVNEMITKDMTTDLSGASIPEVENEMSRRYLMMLQKWLPICMSYFSDWDVRPNCGHFFGGAHWYGNETSGPIKALALISTSPEYDEKITGCSRDEIRQAVIKGIRYLCFTHDTGPEDCVRPEKGLGRPENWGKKWGERGRGFFPESQCGSTISNITSAALILRPWIDDETWMMLSAVCEDYLGRFGEMAPKSGIYADTQMEENAWTSHGLAACYLFLSHHENAEKWEANAKRWMFSTATAPQDRVNHAPFADGLTVSQLTGKTFTMLPDYMAENHGMVHPSYTASGVVSVGSLGNLYRIYGGTEPEHAYWNRQVIYDNLKRMTDFTGSPHCVQGMDWPYLSPRCWLHCVAYLYLKDPDAGYFEQISLGLAEKIQDGFKGKTINPEVAEKCHGPQDPLIIRESGIAAMAAPYLAHRLMGAEAPQPTMKEEIVSKFQGVKIYPHSGFAFHRHAKGQTSFSWRNEIMALSLTREGIFTIAPSRGTLLSKVSVKGHASSQKLVFLRVTEKDNGFATTMINNLASESVRQKVLFASLPNGNVVCLDTLVALKECVVEKVEQGYLQVMNENFPFVKGNCNGYRMLYHPGGEEKFQSFVSVSPDDDRIFPLENPAWLNIDNRIGIKFSGTGKTVYTNRHCFKPYRAIADDLYLSVQDEEKNYGAGDIIAELAFLLCPEQSRNGKPNQRLTKLSSGEDAVCLITPNYLCAGNFASRDEVCQFNLPREDLIPIFSGITKIKENDVQLFLPLSPGQAVFSESCFLVKTDGTVDIEVVEGGSVFLTNTGESRTTILVVKNDEEKMLSLEVGQIVRIESLNPNL